MLIGAKVLSPFDILFLSSSEPTEVKDSLDDELPYPIMLCTFLTVTDGERPESTLGLQRTRDRQKRLITMKTITQGLSEEALRRERVSCSCTEEILVRDVPPGKPVNHLDYLQTVRRQTQIPQISETQKEISIQTKMHLQEKKIY